jgi:putative metal-binding protein/Kelch motif protein
MKRLAFLALAFAGIVCVSAGAPISHDLTLAQRIQGQRTIERIYNSHQIDATLPFAQAVPDELLDRKVRTTLKQSAALEKFWHVTITAAMLQEEMERIRSTTHFPDRLREIEDALGGDPVVIQEVFARPVLVNRLALSFFASDEGIQGPARRRMADLREALLTGALDPRKAHPLRSLLMLERVRDAAFAPEAAGTDETDADSSPVHKARLAAPDFEARRSRAPRRVGEIGPLVEGPETITLQVLLAEDRDHAVIAVYRIEKRSWEEWWNEVEAGLNESSVAQVASNPAYQLPATGASTPSVDCSTIDTWTPTSTLNDPVARAGHTAVWTGNLMIVWGGSDGTKDLSSGGRYDPLTDSWSPTRKGGAPSARSYHTAVWGGNRMMIWGATGDSTGARYDPIADTWAPMTTVDAPSARSWHTAIWTGSTGMIVWGGYPASGTIGTPMLKTGARYDPLSDSWIATSVPGWNAGRSYHSAIWTGTEMIVWGGSQLPVGSSGWSGVVNDGLSYNPASDTWVGLGSLPGSPSPRAKQAAIWTGTEMIIFGGVESSGYWVDTGARFESGTWTPLPAFPLIGGPNTSIWTGSEMVTWGGGANTRGARYRPGSDLWTPTSLTDVLLRTYHTAVWTGGEMVVWGGYASLPDGYQNSGGRYVPDISPDADGDGFSACGGDCDDTQPLVNPAAAEVCNGIDDNCAGGIDEGGAALCPDADPCTLDSCGGASGCAHLAAADGSPCASGIPCRTGEVCLSGSCQGGSLQDSDGDGHGDSACGGDDCSDNDPMVWHAPLDVTNLTLTLADPPDPSWDSQGSQAGPSTLYDIVSGTLSLTGQPSFASASCLQSGSSTSYSDGRQGPAPGSVFWYLARARNACGMGTYGSVQRDASMVSCP